MGVIETEDAYYRVNLATFSPDISVFDRFAKEEENHFINSAKNLEVSSLFYWFADYPVVEYENLNSEHVVIIHDLRFDVIPMKNPFILKIIFKDDGSLKDVSLNGR
jgi:hypothetical protein